MPDMIPNRMEFQFTLTSNAPLLMHKDDVMEGDVLAAWRKNPNNKAISVAGDDRSPPWTWQSYLHHDGTHLAMPEECIMAALRYAGAKIPAPKGKGTFKEMSQSGLTIASDWCEFRNEGKKVPLAAIQAIKGQSFAEQFHAVEKLGFKLMVKRATVGSSKHVRVRARFDHWSIHGSIEVYEPAITSDVLHQMFEIAGYRAGLGDWRPSSPKKPGRYGTFSATLKAVKGAKLAG